VASISEKRNAAGQLIGYRAQIRKAGFPAQSKNFTGRDALAKVNMWVTTTEAQMVVDTFVDLRQAKAMTVREALKRYLREITPTKKGRAQETARINAWLKDPIADYSLTNLSGPILAEWIRKQQAAKLSASTIRNNLCIIGNMYTIAVKKWGIDIPRNPARMVQYPKKAAGRDRRLIDDEYDRLVSACLRCDSIYVRLAIVWAIETAMRQGEILGLTWGDVSIDKRTAHLAETKNGGSRTVPLSKRALVVLAEAATAQPDRKPADRIFPLSRDGLYNAYAKAMRRAKIENLTFHDLRHEATSRMVENPRLKEAQIMKITGHKDWSMFQRYHQMRVGELADLLDD